jgi:hypothetical protein
MGNRIPHVGSATVGSATVGSATVGSVGSCYVKPKLLFSEGSFLEKEERDLTKEDTWNGHESVAPTVALRQMQTIKAVIVGDVGAGKTSLLMSAFGEDTQDMPFLPVCKTKPSPSGVRRMIRTCMQTIFDMQSLNLFVQGNPVSLALWDTAGAEDYGAFALHAAWNGRSRM